jgi:hypothetical protein
MLGDYSIKELLVWLGGMLVAGAFTILGAFYVVDNFVAPRDHTIHC